MHGKLESSSDHAARIGAAVNLFDFHLSCFARPDNPTEPMRSAIARARQTVPHIASSNESQNVLAYDDAWVGLTDQNYFTETQERMALRLTKNSVEPRDIFAGKRVLDAGCGSGNYTFAIAEFGAARVVGIDLGIRGLEFARQKAKHSVAGEVVEYVEASATSIPYPDDHFDVVWSNSVVHVCGDYERALSEAARVLRPGGTMFLYVDGKMGLFEEMSDALLHIMRGVSRNHALAHLETLGIDPGRISWMIALFYVPYERRPQTEIEAMFKREGLGIVRRMARGPSRDISEMIASGAPFAREKYGEGPLKYLLTKLV